MSEELHIIFTSLNYHSMFLASPPQKENDLKNEPSSRVEVYLGCFSSIEYIYDVVYFLDRQHDIYGYTITLSEITTLLRYLQHQMLGQSSYRMGVI